MENVLGLATAYVDSRGISPHSLHESRWDATGSGTGVAQPVGCDRASLDLDCVKFPMAQIQEGDQSLPVKVRPSAEPSTVETEGIEDCMAGSAGHFENDGDAQLASGLRVGEDPQQSLSHYSRGRVERWDALRRA
jgi:hypothetical protein